MTPEEIVKAEVCEPQPAAAAAKLETENDGEQVVTIHPYDGRKKRGQSNDALKNWQTGGLGGNNWRVNGLNSKIDDALFNSTDADHLISHEKAWHRRAIDLSIQGFTVVEIANLLGYSKGQIGTVLAQPWAQVRMIENSKKNVLDEMREFLEAEVMPSLQLIKTIRDDTNLKAEVRSEQASKLLNRFLGKEVQPMVSTAKDEAQMSSAELAAEAQRILEQQRQ